jgi:cellobionic acid phosphorylase
MPPLIRSTDGGARVELTSPVAMPQAGAFLWNRSLLLQVNCRGFVIARHMQPEAAAYSHAPVLEQRTFMQPEQPYYAHHPGRFVYLRDEDDGETFSLPYEPVRRLPDEFVFSAGSGDIHWQVVQLGLHAKLGVSVPAGDVVELWSLTLGNPGDRLRRLSIYPCFSIGYMSWMNQAACYREDLGGVVASSVTPWQKLEEYPAVRSLKDRTFLLHDQAPLAWETSRDAFEGEGGLHDPDALRRPELANGDAIYETPLAALQYRIELAPGASRRFRFLFGPARNDDDIAALRERYLADGAFELARKRYAGFLERGRGCLRIHTPDADFDGFVNHWLGRQVYYHGEANRLTTDPQTRNYLQDAMGMAYVEPGTARQAFTRALGQQHPDGSMPEGIVLVDGAELKYINRVPHTDHCVWLPVCLQAFLDETGDYDFLDDPVVSVSDPAPRTIFERVCNAMRWLIDNCDERNLSLIAQGDWCDPMNMVGPGGRGVSAWLTIATVHALRLWSDLARWRGDDAAATEMAAAANAMADASRQHFWDGAWFARGITDDGVRFGVSDDAEGRIYLNPQSWALLAGIATDEQTSRILDAVGRYLDTPFGPMLLAPAYTAMREDIGRITQKHPGCAENGSIYNHAAAFWLCALYRLHAADRAYDTLRRMIPGPSEDDFRQRGQLPVFVPNYYRGAVAQFPRTAGRSSQLFNTGAASWLYRCIIEGLFGLTGCREGLRIAPDLPSHWPGASLTRRFRGTEFHIEYRRDADTHHTRLMVDGGAVAGTTVSGFQGREACSVEVILPASAS